MMDRFAASGFEPVDVNGKQVYPFLALQPAIGERLVLRWVGAHSPRVQGVALRLRRVGARGARGRGGLLRVDDVEAPSILLWMDTAPPVVTVEVVAIDADAELRVSNRWRTDDGVEHEWLNNYGMMVESKPDGEHVLWCSDGFGYELNERFDDLILSVALRR